MPFTPPLESPSRRHPAGGIENEIFSPAQSNVSRGNSCGGAGRAGVDLHAGAARTTRARQAGSAEYRHRSANLIRSCAGMLTLAWTLNPLNVAQRPEDLPRRGPACAARDRTNITQRSATSRNTDTSANPAYPHGFAHFLFLLFGVAAPRHNDRNQHAASSIT